MGIFHIRMTSTESSRSNNLSFPKSNPAGAGRISSLDAEPCWVRLRIRRCHDFTIDCHELIPEVNVARSVQMVYPTGAPGIKIGYDKSGYVVYPIDPPQTFTQDKATIGFQTWTGEGTILTFVGPDGKHWDLVMVSSDQH